MSNGLSMSNDQDPRILIVHQDPEVIAQVQSDLGVRGSSAAMWTPPALQRMSRSTSTPGPFSLTVVDRGESALARLKAGAKEGGAYALAIVDLRLTDGWDGLMTIQQLWREQPDLQVILCRNPGDGTWEQITGRLGISEALAILTAPVDSLTLRQMAYGMIRRWQQGRRAAEMTDELRRAQRQVQAVIDYLPSPICLRDLEGRFLLTNGAFRQHFKTTSEAVFGRRAEEVLPAAIAWLFPPLDREALQGDTPVEFEVVQPGIGDAEPTAWLVSKWPLHGLDGHPYAVCALFTDLSRRKAEEDQVRQGLSLRSQVRMAAEVGHKFGNLLTLIGGNTEVALKRVGPDHPAQALLTETLRAVGRGADLTRQLTIFARKGALRPEELDLGALVTGQAEELRRILLPGIEVHVQVPPVAVPVRLDGGQFSASLLDVALGQGGDSDRSTGRIDLRLVTVETPDGPQAELWIQRSLPGEPAGADPFANPGDGGNLGLAAARVLCEQMGGSARRRLQPGGGLAFVLAIPVSQPVELQPVPLPPGSGTSTILVAEDESAVRELVAEVLREAGYQVLVACDGQEALGVAWSSSQPIDLLVTDAIMPRLDGLALAERVRARHPTAKVLVMSGYTESMAVQGGLRRTAASFIQKPFSLDALMDAVRRLLGPASPRIDQERYVTPMRGLPVLPER